MFLNEDSITVLCADDAIASGQLSSNIAIELVCYTNGRVCYSVHHPD